METTIAPSQVSSSVPPLALTPAEAWQPLPASDWNEGAARHLLRRAGWSSQPSEVARAVSEGLPRTLERLFPAQAELLSKPKLVENLQEDSPDFIKRAQAAPAEQKRQLQREARERSQQAMQDLSIKWLQFAADPVRSSVEKWVLFLSDIYVVSYE